MKLSKKINIFKTLASTNDYIKENISMMPYGTVIQALEQTKGRGRFGNTWLSDFGNLYFSFLYEPIENIFDLNIKVSVVIIELLKEVGIEAYIKYPNDIIVNDKKISGILIETKGYISKRKVIVGVGLNILQKDFSELKNSATSIALETKSKKEHLYYLRKFITIFNEIDGDLYEKYLSYSMIIGKEIEYLGVSKKVKNITRTGDIILVDKDGEIKVSFDTISLTSIYQKNT